MQQPKKRQSLKQNLKLKKGYFSLKTSFGGVKKKKALWGILGVIVIATGIFLNACMVGPDYQTPHTFDDASIVNSLKKGQKEHRKFRLNQNKNNDKYQNEKIELFKEQEKYLLDFQDPILTNLIDRVKRDNLTIAQIVSRLKQARFYADVVRSGEAPTFDLAGRHNSVHESRNMGLIEEGDYFQVGLDATWELDIFGGNRRKIEMAEAGIRSISSQLCDVQISLISEISLSYIQYRMYESLLQKARQNLELQIEIEKLTHDKYDQGLVDRISLDQSQYAVEQIRSSIPLYLTQIEIQKNKMTFLTGQLPGDLDVELSQKSNLVNRVFKYNINQLYDLPASVIRSRPDVRISEENLIAQNAQLGVAISELYPQVKITSFLGLGSLNSGDLLSSNSFLANIFPQISLPLFHFGALRKNVALQTERKEEQILRYEQAILLAVQDVKNALVRLEKEQKRNKSLRLAYNRMKSAANLIRNRYHNGLNEYTDVLNAEERRIRAQNDLIHSNADQYENIILLYKAIGGDYSF